MESPYLKGIMRQGPGRQNRITCSRQWLLRQIRCSMKTGLVMDISKFTCGTYWYRDYVSWQNLIYFLQWHSQSSMWKDNSNARLWASIITLYCNKLQPSRRKTNTSDMICFSNIPIQGAFQKRLRARKFENPQIFTFQQTTSFNIWARYVVWNLRAYLWNPTQNNLPIHWTMCNIWRIPRIYNELPRHIKLWCMFSNI